jgi:hypothetical protein
MMLVVAQLEQRRLRQSYAVSYSTFDVLCEWEYFMFTDDDFLYIQKLLSDGFWLWWRSNDGWKRIIGLAPYRDSIREEDREPGPVGYLEGNLGYIALWNIYDYGDIIATMPHIMKWPGEAKHEPT